MLQSPMVDAQAPGFSSPSHMLFGCSPHFLKGKVRQNAPISFPRPNERSIHPKHAPGTGAKQSSRLPSSFLSNLILPFHSKSSRFCAATSGPRPKPTEMEPCSSATGKASLSWPINKLGRGPRGSFQETLGKSFGDWIASFRSPVSQATVG